MQSARQGFQVLCDELANLAGDCPPALRGRGCVFCFPGPWVWPPARSSSPAQACGPGPLCRPGPSFPPILCVGSQPGDRRTEWPVGVLLSPVVRAPQSGVDGNRRLACTPWAADGASSRSPASHSVSAELRGGEVCPAPTPGQPSSRSWTGQWQLHRFVAALLSLCSPGPEHPAMSG